MTRWQWIAVTSVWGVAMASETTATENAGAWPELGVELVDTVGLDDGILVEVRGEVERLYRLAGVRVRWRTPSPVEVEAHAARVFLMKALPSHLDLRLRAFGRARPMGMALGRLQQTSGPVIYVATDVVAATIAGDADRFGTALGRVVAHELGHRFLQRAHTRRGLMKADLGRNDLVGSGSHLTLDDRLSERLRLVARASAREER